MPFERVPYVYDNLKIPGGGYVTGFAFHPSVPEILYARTDIGGCYRYDFKNDSWISLVEHVTHIDRSETFPLAIALDPEDPATLYVASGLGRPTLGKFPNGYFSVSHDYGESFEVKEMPCHVHGNSFGRGTGTRMLVDPMNSDVIYFASQEAGLLRSPNRGDDWEIIDVKTEKHPVPETNLAFVWVAPNSKTIVVAADGTANSKDKNIERAHSLYVSYNAGASWEELGQPEPFDNDNTKLKGYVGHRYDYDGRYLYVTLNETGKWAYFPGYSCDCGSVINGRVIRFSVDSSFRLGEFEEITPVAPEYGIVEYSIPCGFGGICSTPQIPGLLLCATLCIEGGDTIFMSKDFGKSWEVKLHNLDIGRMHFNSSYMKPEYNGQRSLIHWLTDIKINPFNADQAFFNTGTGVFGTENLLQPAFSWCDHCKGIEETVHLNIYAPVKGDIIALDILGDLGGFVFTQTEEQCENSFADEKGDRYITSINADYPDNIPNVFAATPRGNWTGRTQGGVVYTEDAGKTLRHCVMPFGLSGHIDGLLKSISMPNVNSGWVAMSPDSKRLIWSVADRDVLPWDAVVYSTDKGYTWNLSKVHPAPGKPVPKYFKAFYDRIDNYFAYGFGENSRLYISSDGGANFYEKEAPAGFPVRDMSAIDAKLEVEIRGIAGEFGTFLMAMSQDGLWKVRYNRVLDAFIAERITPEGDEVYCVGLGIAPGESDYITGKKAVYICGMLDGTFGFFRSYDSCKTWQQINNEKQNFGEIKSVDGDKRVPGRYFIATGTRGLKFGVPEN